MAGAAGASLASRDEILDRVEMRESPGGWQGRRETFAGMNEVSFDGENVFVQEIEGAELLSSTTCSEFDVRWLALDWPRLCHLLHVYGWSVLPAKL